MRGRYVARKGGWDCHGLPVEIEVEKELGITNKHEIEEFGIDRVQPAVPRVGARYVEDWSALTTRIGMWLDTDDAYWTLDNDYIESVWWQFKPDLGRGRHLRGPQGRPLLRALRHRAVEPRAGSAGRVPGHHRPVGLRALPGRRPRLRPARVDHHALDADLQRRAPRSGPTIEYVRVRDGVPARDLVLAAARVGDVLGDDVEVVGPVPVDDLVGLHYERPFDFLPLDTADAARVVADDFVTIDDGSGIVHLAPAFGEIDREVAEREGLPMLNPVGPDGDRSSTRRTAGSS